jgi:mono/diheme cytochrome c family protein
MKRILKWTLAVVVVLAAVGFVAFLYFIPPLTQMAPEEFIQQAGAMPPAATNISDPAERAIADRGRYLVLTADCGGCHTTQGAQGPEPAYYLAGGMTFATNTHGTVVSRNLTPDRATGTGSKSPDDLKRVLRSGVFPDGRGAPPLAMPWPGTSNWSDEDLHAVVTYLRSLKPIHHAIPAPKAGRGDAIVPGAAEVAYSLDAGKK